MTFGGDSRSGAGPVSSFMTPFFRPLDNALGAAFGWGKKPEEAPKPATLLTAPPQMVDTPGRHKTLLGA